jgi:3-deoxy-manno-octulosonate cytidylyltransferase (CMP-KDO synthetase)
MKAFKQLHFTGIIPSRYASTRFPGKPLALIGDRSMIQRVYEQASKSLDNVFVATDDERIMKAVLDFGGKVIMTSAKHKSGTDRCSEAVSIIESETNIKTDVVINIQGDEPFIRPEQIDLVAACFEDDTVEIATLICNSVTNEDIINPDQIKVVLSLKGDALYFSRATIPFIRGIELSEWPSKHNFYKHLGIYGYKKDVLKELTLLNESSLEIAEALEQNRWLENGYKIRTALTSWDSYGIDKPDDIEMTMALNKDFI